jgi:hypothetical protein
MKIMKMRSKALLGLGVMLLVCVTVAFAAVNVKGLIVDALTGYTVAGAAPSGHTLCGNGTVYVDSATPCGTIYNPTVNIVTGSRVMSTVYQNTTGYPMTVEVSYSQPSSGSCTFYWGTSSFLGGSQAVEVHGGSGGTGTRNLSFVVPNGTYYSATTDTAGTLTQWVEIW